MAEASDRELIDSANRGDAAAMETLYFRHRDWAMAMATRLCGNRDDALDVVQETFAYLFGKLGKFGKLPGFQLRCLLRTFLYPVVRNLSLNRIRKRRATVWLDSDAAGGLAAESDGPAAQRADLAEWVEALDAGARELVMLRFYDGCRLGEIAEILSLPLGTVKSRLHRALALLRERLGPDV